MRQYSETYHTWASHVCSISHTSINSYPIVEVAVEATVKLVWLHYRGRLKCLVLCQCYLGPGRLAIYTGFFVSPHNSAGSVSSSKVVTSSLNKTLVRQCPKPVSCNSLTTWVMRPAQISHLSKATGTAPIQYNEKHAYLYCYHGNKMATYSSVASGSISKCSPSTYT